MVNQEAWGYGENDYLEGHERWIIHRKGGLFLYLKLEVAPDSRSTGEDKMKRGNMVAVQWDRK